MAICSPMHPSGNDYSKYLDIPEDSNEKTWPGFKPRSSTGMELLHAGGGLEK